MEGKTIGSSIIRLGFGKIKPSQYVWLDDLSEKMSESELKTICKNYGTVKSVKIDKQKGQGLINFSSIEHAKYFVSKLRAKKFYEKRIMIDFASIDFKKRFENSLNKDREGICIEVDDTEAASEKIVKNSSKHYLNANLENENTNENNSESPVTTIGKQSSSSSRYHYSHNNSNNNDGNSNSNSFYQFSSNSHHHHNNTVPSTTVRHRYENNPSRDSSPHSLQNNKNLNRNYSIDGYNIENLTRSNQSKRQSSVSRSCSRSRNSRGTTSESKSRSRSKECVKTFNKSPLSDRHSPTKKHSKKFQCKY